MAEPGEWEDPEAEDAEAEGSAGATPGEDEDTSPGEPPPREADGWASDAPI